MPDVPRMLLDQVDEDPPQAGCSTVGPGVFGQLIRAGQQPFTYSMLMHGEYREGDPVTRLGYTFNQGEANDNEILAIVDLKCLAALLRRG